MGAPNDSCSSTGTCLSLYLPSTVWCRKALFSMWGIFFPFFVCMYVCVCVSYLSINVQYVFVTCVLFFYFTIITLLSRLAVLSFKTIHPLVSLCGRDNTYHPLFSWRSTIQLKPDRGYDGYCCKVAHKTFESTINVCVLIFCLHLFTAMKLETPAFLIKRQHVLLTELISTHLLVLSFTSAWLSRSIPLSIISILNFKPFWPHRTSTCSVLVMRQGRWCSLLQSCAFFDRQSFYF